MSLRKKDPLPSLDALDARIKAAQAEQQVEATPARHSDSNMGIKVALDLVSGTAVGGVIGYGIDYYAGTMPWFFLGCLILGMAAGFRLMIQSTTRYSVQSANEKAVDDALTAAEKTDTPSPRN